MAVKLQDPVFDSQTKSKLGSTDVRSWLVPAVREQVALWLHQNPEAAERLLEKVKSNERVRKELSAIKKEARERAQEGGHPHPEAHRLQAPLRRRGKRAREETARSSSPRATPPGGVMVQCRDVLTQAIFALQGQAAELPRPGKRDAIYKNEELYNLMRALGIEDGIDGLRYNRVVVATDADVDGMHIRNLLLTYFLRYFEELVLKGHLFILETPLFGSATSARPAIATPRRSAATRRRPSRATR